MRQPSRCGPLLRRRVRVVKLGSWSVIGPSYLFRKGSRICANFDGDGRKKSPSLRTPRRPPLALGKNAGKSGNFSLGCIGVIAQPESARLRGGGKGALNLIFPIAGNVGRNVILAVIVPL